MTDKIKRGIDPEVTNQTLDIVRNVRGRVYKLLPKDIEHEERLALASTYALNSLLLGACEIAVEYDMPVLGLLRSIGANYEMMLTDEGEVVH